MWMYVDVYFTYVGVYFICVDALLTVCEPQRAHVKTPSDTYACMYM